MTDAGGAQSPAQLTGAVLDATGLPLAGATITIRGVAESVTHTDDNGQFDFPRLPAGDYDLIAALQGFVPARQSARLTPGERTTVSLTLAVQLLAHTIVTATRAGETDVQATPIAVSVLTGTEVSRLQDRTVEDMARRVPSVFFTQNTGLAQVTIRGIGTNAVFAGSDPSSAVYLDGVYLARPGMVLADFLDLDRIEVLRGPQGTLYGRNSLGGAINLITVPPTNELDVSVRVGGGNQGAFRADARVSGPIVPGKVLGSASILRGVRNGTVRDLEHPDHPLGGEDIIGARGQLRVVFDARSELRLSADLTHSEPAPVYYSKILAVKPGFDVDTPSGLLRRPRVIS